MQRTEETDEGDHREERDLYRRESIQRLQETVLIRFQFQMTLKLGNYRKDLMLIKTEG